MAEALHPYVRYKIINVKGNTCLDLDNRTKEGYGSFDLDPLPIR